MIASELPAVWNVNRRRFRDIYDEFDQTVNWLSQFKSDHLSTRIAKYRKSLSLLADAHDAGRVRELLESWNEDVLMNDFLEASSLNLIHRGLCNFDNGDAVLRDKINDLFSGPDHSNDENPATSNTLARNTSFELVLSARFALAGYEIHFDREADLIITDKPSVLFVESKRIYSPERIEGNVRKAFKQLHRRYEAADPKMQKRGLIAISISKLVNPKQKLLSTRNVDHLRAVLNKQVVGFIEEHKRHWDRQDDRNTVGIIIHLHVPAEITDANEIFTCREIALKNIQPIGSPEDQYSNEVGKRLQDAVPRLQA